MNSIFLKWFLFAFIIYNFFPESHWIFTRQMVSLFFGLKKSILQKNQKSLSGGIRKNPKHFAFVFQGDFAENIFFNRQSTFYPTGFNQFFKIISLERYILKLTSFWLNFEIVWKKRIDILKKVIDIFHLKCYSSMTGGIHYSFSGDRWQTL